MKINWKIRFRNKVWLTTFIGAIISFGYNILSMFGITPDIDQAALMNIMGSLLTFLTLIGVVVDPTTEGTNDSDRAMTYGRYDVAEQDARGSGIDAYLEEQNEGVK